MADEKKAKMTDDEKKQKRREQNKKYREANKEKIKQSRQDYHEANKEVLNEKSRQYRQDNKKEVAEYNRIWSGARHLCVCGKEVRRDGKITHEASKSHLKFMETYVKTPVTPAIDISSASEARCEESETELTMV